MTTHSRLLAAAAGVALLTAAGASLADTGPGPSGLRVVARIAGPDGGWDYASFDAARRRVYIAQGMRVVAINADTGAVTAAFAQGNHLHAVTPVPGTDRIVTTNSGDNTAKILDAETGALIASVPTADDADSALYDPASGEVLIVGGDSGQIDFLDPKAAKVTASIKSGGRLEFLALDGHGKLFVNDEARHHIVVIDLARKVVTGFYDMPGCVAPTGLAYVTGGRLVAACGNGVAEILDAASGRVIASPKIGARPDAVIYDPGRHMAYIPSGGTGTLSVIALSGPGDNTVIDTIPTQLGARTGALDPKTGRIYLPAAEYLPPAGPGQRPSVKPGTFKVLVLDRS